MINFRQQLSLDYLKAARSASGGGPSVASGWSRPGRIEPDPLAEATLLMSRPILDLLAQAGDRAKVFDMVDALNLPIDQVQQALMALERQGLVETIEADMKGDHLVELTQRGKEALR